MRRNKKGFTIIEVVLFLALSGLLFLVGFIGVGLRTRSVQSTDSMRSLESYIQQELNEVISGVNVQGSSAGEDSSRIIIGKLFSMNGSNIDVYTIVGNRLSGDQLTVGPGGTEIDLIDAAQPRALGDISGPRVSPYDVRWGSTFDQAFNQGVASDYTVFGFLRSPGSTQIYPIALDTSGMDLSGNLLDSASYSIGSEVDFQACYELPDGKRAALLIAPGSQNESAEILFEGSLC